MWFFFVIRLLVLRRSYSVLGFRGWEGEIFFGVGLSGDGVGFRFGGRGLFLYNVKKKESEFFVICIMD